MRAIGAAAILTAIGITTIGEIANGNQEARREDKINEEHAKGNYAYYESTGDILAYDWPDLLGLVGIVGGITGIMAAQGGIQEVKRADALKSTAEKS